MLRISEASSSALARNDPGLLNRSDPLLGPETELDRRYPITAEDLLAGGQNTYEIRIVMSTIVLPERNAFGVHDIDSYAPHAGRPAKTGENVFFVWVSLTEHKWVILRERRRACSEISPCCRSLRSASLCQAGRVALHAMISLCTFIKVVCRMSPTYPWADRLSY
jgi:hypothetical protein